jgi:ATP-dependent Clp protease ATP-binding subunit ClpC
MDKLKGSFWSRAKTGVVIWMVISQASVGVVPQATWAVEPSLKEKLEPHLDSKGKSPLSIFFKAVERFVTDEVAEQDRLGELVEIYGREKETDEVLDVLVRMKGRNPVLVGEAGVGKTAVVDGVAQKIYRKELPPGAAYRDLKTSAVVEVSAASISSLAESTSKNAQQNVMRDFLKGLQEAEKIIGKKIVLFMDEMHALQPAGMQVMKTYMESTKGIHFIGATTFGEYQQMIKHDDAMRSRFESVMVREFNPTQAFDVLKRSWVPTMERKYNVRFSDAAIRAAIRMAPEYDSFGHRPRAPMKVLQDAAILAHRQSNGASTQVSDTIVGEQVTRRLGLPLNPANREKFNAQIDELKGKLRDRVVDQERVTDTMVDLWADLNEGVGKSHRVMVIAGPTGGGKTFSGEQFAELALGSKERMLEISMNSLSHGPQAKNTLFGASNGFESAAETSGIIPDFLAGRGRGANVILVNEWEKADKQTQEAFMEMLDKGYVQGNDGKMYPLGKSLVVLTTNKGDNEIYPRGRSKPMSRAEQKKKMDGLSDQDIRKMLSKPDRNDVFNKEKISHASVYQRVDAAVPAVPPSFEGAVKISHQIAENVSADLYEQHRIKVQLDPQVAEYIARTYYVPEDGVRDVKRATEKLVKSVRRAFENQYRTIAEGDVLKVSMVPSENSDHPLMKVASSISQHQTVQVDAPLNRRVLNPLKDADAREKLANLEERLSEKVFGQPEAIATAAKAIRQRATNLHTSTAAWTVDLGPTGTGKTELGKAVAEVLFDDPEAYKAFSVGEINDWHGLRRFFGSDPGLIGSNQMSPFEKFLNDYPHGVIDFSEAGNMGKGLPKEQRDQLFYYFFDMKDEGTWTSPNTGETYNLRNYYIRFTSNEGQELFQNYPSDQLRMAAWERINSRTARTELLKRHGWPEALVARMQGNVTVYRPTVESTRNLIAKKFVDKTIHELKEQHGFKDFIVDEKFYKAVADSFFSHSEGARSMRALAEQELTDIFSEALFNGVPEKDMKKAIFRASLSDNYEGLFRFKGKTPPERDVRLTLTAEIPGREPLVFSRNLADAAAEKNIVSSSDAKRVSKHEAAHGVVNDPNLTGEETKFMTIRGQGGYGGYAYYKDIPGRPLRENRESAVARIGRILAGGLYEEIYVPGGRTSGWASDKQKAAEYAETAVAKYGLSERALKLPTQNGKVMIEHPDTQLEIQKLLEEGEAYARKRIRENLPLIRKVAARLYVNGHMEGDEYEQLVKSASQPPAARGGGSSLGSCVINNLHIK